MKLLASLDHLYDECRRNRWFRYFAVFCRVALALGFIPSGHNKALDASCFVTIFLRIVVNKGKLDFEDVEPIKGWVEVATFVDADRIYWGDTGSLWILGRAR